MLTMSPWATLSVLGLYQDDKSLFEGLVVPDGVDSETVINKILLECANLEVLYPDADVMKQAITMWSTASQYTWERLYKSTTYDYDPIYNYDRMEKFTDTRNLATSNTASGSTTTTTDDANNTVHSVIPFDTTVFQDASQDHTDASGKVTNNGSSTSNNTDQGTITHEGRAYGNIGVTTTQQMLEQERNIAEFSIYNYIADDFRSKFCLGVY